MGRKRKPLSWDASYKWFIIIIIIFIYLSNFSKQIKFLNNGINSDEKYKSINPDPLRN